MRRRPRLTRGLSRKKKKRKVMIIWLCKLQVTSPVYVLYFIHFELFAF